MEAPRTTIDTRCPGTFADKVAVELNRAERYRVFVSLTIIDLGPAREIAADQAAEVLEDVTSRVKAAVRACDHVDLLMGHCLAVLQPETPRQGAEIAARRLTEIVKGSLKARYGDQADRAIPVEIASYPDTAGARTMQGFLEDMVKKSQN
ncbi:MAG: hypothetical protein AB1772_01980 [Candidatus Zixiibacteriota bacterium]